MDEHTDVTDPRRAVTQAELQAIYDDLVSVEGIAMGLGVNKELVKKWIVRRDIVDSPQPVRLLPPNLRIYSMSEWRSWHVMWKLTRLEPWREARLSGWRSGPRRLQEGITPPRG